MPLSGTRFDALGDVLRVASDARKEPGRHRVGEKSPTKYSPGASATIPRRWIASIGSFSSPKTQVDPGEVWTEARAPDDVRRLDDAVVLEQRQSVTVLAKISAATSASAVQPT